MGINVVVTGTGMTKFGELWSESVESLSKAACLEALEEAKLKMTDIDVLIVGNMLLSQLEMRAHVGGVVSDAISFYGPSAHVEAACASGGLAIYQAVSLLKAGKAKRVLVIGVEKMTDASSEEITRALMAAGSEDEQLSGLTFPSLYALMMQDYMQKFHVTAKEIGYASVSSHAHGVFNPLAQFRKAISIDNVMSSPVVSDPITQLMCSPISDGAAAVVLEAIEDTKGKVEIVGSGHGGDTLALSKRKKRTELVATKQAVTVAIQESGIQLKDIDVVEVHDCFSIAHILAIEDLGFVKKGVGAKKVKMGFGSLENKGVVVNSSGGLKACGHPVGATGVKQIVEVTRQLQGVCGKRQVRNAKVGLTHNVGGTGTTAVVHILQRNI